MYFNDTISDRVPFPKPDSRPIGEMTTLPVEICEILTAADIVTYRELWTTLFVNQQEVPALSPMMLKAIRAFFRENGCEVEPGPAERFYDDILTRLAMKGEVAKPKGGYSRYLRSHFDAKDGDKYEIATRLRDVCHLHYEERQPLIEYFGLQLSIMSSKAQIAKLRGTTVPVIERQIADTEDKIIENHEMLNWMRSRHPEVWPAYLRPARFA